MNITIVWDNNACEEGLEVGWGFSCVVRGLEKVILFDTGPGAALLENMERLAIEAASVEVVVLSHVHPDHTGGLGSFLEKNSAAAVYLPKVFPEKFKDSVRAQGAKIVEVEQPVEICEGAYSTGQVGGWIKEQSLIVRTDRGSIVIVGCGHPGITNILEAAGDLLGDDVLLVVGGLHLEWASRAKIEKVISAFRELGVRNVGLCHCCGHKGRSLFEKEFGEGCLDCGAGRKIGLANLA